MSIDEERQRFWSAVQLNSDRITELRSAVERAQASANEVHQIKTQVEVISSQMKAMAASVEKLVTRHEFDPIRLLVYGLVGCVLTGLIASILSRVLIK